MCVRIFIVLDSNTDKHFVGNAEQIKNWVVEQADEYGEEVSDYEHSLTTYELATDKPVTLIFTKTITMEVK